MSQTPVFVPPSSSALTVRALLLGDRLDTSGLERNDMVSAAPLAFRIGSHGFAALFRFGVVVLVGLSPVEEDDFLAKLKVRVIGGHGVVDDETATLDVAADHEDRIAPGGPIFLHDLSGQRFLVVADALAKTVSLARDEREVSAVFDIVEPLAQKLARSGRPPGDRRSMLKLIGQALLVQHRVSGRIAIEDKPDVLWDRPDLERLYARLEDEYELKERAGTLKRKLDVIVETVRALTDIIEADRATRLEATIVVLILAEILITVIQMLVFGKPR